MKELSTGLINALVCVGAEVVPLRVQQIRGQLCRAVTIPPRKRRRWTRRRNAKLHGIHDRPTPGRLPLAYCVAEERIKHQIDEIPVVIERPFNLAQECRPDDAAAVPSRGDSAEIEVPAVRLSGRTQ